MSNERKEPMRLIILALVIVAPISLQAATKQQWANNMAQTQTMGHDPVGGRENVFWSSNSAFPRLQARAAWRNSPGHRANLPMVGLRVSRSGGNVYVVGR